MKWEPLATQTLGSSMFLVKRKLRRTRTATCALVPRAERMTVLDCVVGDVTAGAGFVMIAACIGDVCCTTSAAIDTDSIAFHAFFQLEFPVAITGAKH